MEGVKACLVSPWWRDREEKWGRRRAGSVRGRGDQCNPEGRQELGKKVRREGREKGGRAGVGARARQGSKGQKEKARDE